MAVDHIKHVDTFKAEAPGKAQFHKGSVTLTVTTIVIL